MTLPLKRTLQDWLDLGLTPANLSPHTRKNYARSVSRLARDLGDVDLESVSTRDLKRWQSLLLTQMQESSVLQYHSGVRQFFAWLVEEGDLPSNPMDGVPWPKVPRATKPRPLDAPVLRALLFDVAKPRRGRSDFERTRDTALLSFIIDTGCRASEALTVDTDTLDVGLREARVTGKGGKVRTLRFGKDTARALRRYLHERPRHPLAEQTKTLWLGRRGPLTYAAVWEMVKKAAHRAGVLGVHPHLFRHTFAHTRLDAGMQEGDVARLLGHRSTKMVHEVYAAALAEQRALEAYDRFEAPLDTDASPRSYRVAKST